LRLLNRYFCQSRILRSWFINWLHLLVYSHLLSSRSASACANTMRRIFALTLFVLATMFTYAQDDAPLFKTEAASAFVWGEDGISGAVSSSVKDPLTGNAIHKLTHGGVEVSSRAGFERLGSGKAGEVLSFATTIVNNTGFELSVRQGGASVDGQIALPLPVVLAKYGLNKRQRNQVWDLANMSCFSSGFLPNEVFLSLNASTKILAPRTSLTVSSVVKDPRNYSVICSSEGCFPKGTIRFSVTVNATDFVFVWPGREVVYCGK